MYSWLFKFHSGYKLKYKTDDLLLILSLIYSSFECCRKCYLTGEKMYNKMVHPKFECTSM